MKVLFINIRDAEEVHRLEEDQFCRYAEDFLKKGEPLTLNGERHFVEMDVLPGWQDVIPLHFMRHGEKTERRLYYVLGNMFAEPFLKMHEDGGHRDRIVHPYLTVERAYVFVHSEDDATNEDWALD